MARSQSASGTSEQHQKKMMKHSHAVPPGRSLIERIQAQMDKRRKVMEELVIQHGLETPSHPEYLVNKGRYEGMAASLALLRSSSVAEEIRRSTERLGIE